MGTYVAIHVLFFDFELVFFNYKAFYDIYLCLKNVLAQLNLFFTPTVSLLLLHALLQFYEIFFNDIV